MAGVTKRRLLLLGLAGLLLAVGAVLLFWPVADKLAEHDVRRLTGAARAAALPQARDAARGRVVQFGSIVLGFGALMFTARNFRLSREQSELNRQTLALAVEQSNRQADANREALAQSESAQITDRFAKAIELLGSDVIDARLGAIYALERIARDSARDHPAVMEVLTAFVRRASETSAGSFPYDLQAAFTVISRRDTSQDRDRLLFRDAMLDRLQLPGARFARADLTGVRLVEANLGDADLSGIDLTGADLSRAVLDAARLPDAVLTRVNGPHARFRRAVLTRADLTGANFGEGSFDDADLTGATAVGCVLDEAGLSRAVLRDAVLESADLTDAVLDGADLTTVRAAGAKLPRANLSGATLTGADLSRANLGDANLRAADLSGATVSGANLFGATLTDAVLNGVDLTALAGGWVELGDALADTATILPPGWTLRDGRIRRADPDH